jgi:hypothetical protein
MVCYLSHANLLAPPKITEGEANSNQIAAFLVLLASKGETVGYSNTVTSN